MIGRVLYTEFLKLHRCRVTWFTLAGVSMGPLGVALMMWIVREPDRAAKLGLLGTKANLSGLTATSPAFFSMLSLIVGISGMLLLPFIVAYVFGREYSDATAKNLLALPVGRPLFVYAKLAISAVWWFVLVVVMMVEAVIVCASLSLPGFTVAVILSGLGNSLMAAGISFLLAPVVAWITMLGRGYMAPIGFSLAMMALGNILSKTGWAGWFPWSVVPSLIGTIGKPSSAVSPGIWFVLILTFVLGILAARYCLVLADNDQ